MDMHCNGATEKRQQPTNNRWEVIQQADRSNFRLTKLCTPSIEKWASEFVGLFACVRACGDAERLCVMFFHSLFIAAFLSLTFSLLSQYSHVFIIGFSVSVSLSLFGVPFKRPYQVWMSVDLICVCFFYFGACEYEYEWVSEWVFAFSFHIYILHNYLYI